MTLHLPVATLYSFLLALARAGGFVAFLPVPGFRNAPQSARAVLTLAVTLALFPVWPVPPSGDPSIGNLTYWAFAEAGFGLAAGVSVSLLLEGFQIAAQITGLQAGYGYASTIDPNSEADSSVLQVMASLSSGLLFFATGLDHEFIRALAASFSRFPSGATTPSASASLDGILKLGSAMLATGLRLAFPVAALLLLSDFALALVSRVQQQLQLHSLAFPGKMAAALALLAALAPVVPKIFSTEAEKTLAALWRILGG
ncbi:MAG TPA: flagellar biosynthetic protein FliR [Bryobacteraceae bacterium]|nr:flagellar biosynthetic protein FliR [Bryobacteraceae bacterium]